MGNGLAGGTTYDGARRPVRSTLGGANFEPFTERLAWSKRNLKTATQREDLNGRGYVVAYDGAGRLVEAAKAENPLDLAPNNSTPAAATVAALSESYGYSYDAAENLLEQRPERFAISAHQSSPSDGSGRNRPGSFAGQTLSWDGNGNLIRKGADHFAWDYRNRLTRVTRDGVGEIARYEYDAFNRLSKRTVGGEVQEWAWSGWQLLERYKNGQLAMRRTYGQGLDEVVRQESDSDGDGVLETVTIPVYDSIGNAVAITDESGKAIERYEYSPYGTRTIRVDLTPPVVEQLREADGQLLLEFSEEILLQRIEQAITGGTLTLRDTTDDEPVTITASQPVRDGKQKGRRLLLTPDPGAPPEANHAMLLHIEPSAMADLFENRSETAYEKAFVWLDADHVIEDTTPPRVELLLTKTGELELGWSEAIDAESASQRILLDGQTLTWITTPDGYTLKPDVAISATTHTLQVTGQLADLGGNAIAAPWSHSVTTGGTDRIVYERPDERITPTSTLDNLASFQGHITDPATGLVYMRNRWMDPEMGRFLSPDPMGTADGASMYALDANDPSNNSDPLGLAIYAFDGTCNDFFSNPNEKTNVAKLFLALAPGTQGEYISGIGAPDCDGLSGAYDSGTGFGASERLEVMYQRLTKNFNKGDREIDIFGFSRGSALARAFANMIHERGIPDLSQTRPKTLYAYWGQVTVQVPASFFESPPIRFLGLFDTVGSFWLGNGSDVDLSIAPNVQRVRHAVAMDERRYLFPLSSIHSSPREHNSERLLEVGFPGAHSDVGGGYGRGDHLSKAPLFWMWSEAVAAGVPLGPLVPSDLALPGNVRQMSHDSRWSIDFWHEAHDEVYGGRKPVRKTIYYPARKP
ncbi:MAG: DUF2235 domain-containing protein [Thermoanaerobaculia bacterium]